MSWQILDQLSHWHWFILGLLLLVGEALGAAGFLLGSSIAAFITGVLVWVIQGLTGSIIGWELQVFVAALLSVLCSVVYWRFFRAEKQASDRPQLNHRAAQLIGRRLVLAQAVEFQGRIQIGDTFWKVTCDEILQVGDNVEVVDAELTELILRKID